MLTAWDKREQRATRTTRTAVRTVRTTVRTVRTTVRREASRTSPKAESDATGVKIQTGALTAARLGTRVLEIARRSRCLPMGPDAHPHSHCDPARTCAAKPGWNRNKLNLRQSS